MNRMLNLLGLCARAGKLVSGEKACLQAIRGKSVRVVILDRAAAANAVKAVTDACASHDVALVYAPETMLGDAIGKPGRMVAAVTDPPLADRIRTLATQEQ